MSMIKRCTSDSSIRKFTGFDGFLSWDIYPNYLRLCRAPVCNFPTHRCWKRANASPPGSWFGANNSRSDWCATRPSYHRRTHWRFHSLQFPPNSSSRRLLFGISTSELWDLEEFYWLDLKSTIPGVVCFGVSMVSQFSILLNPFFCWCQTE